MGGSEDFGVGRQPHPDRRWVIVNNAVRARFPVLEGERLAEAASST
jgi:hypothetical protein